MPCPELKENHRSLVTRHGQSHNDEADKNNHLSTRLQKIFSSISQPVSGPSIFWVTFGDKKLQVMLEDAPYKSYLFSEADFFKDFYPHNHVSFPTRYHRIKVCETMEEEKKLVLECWSTLDALVLELFELSAGFGISGTEIFKIFQDFLLLIQPKNILLQDQSRINIKNPAAEDEVEVPLRLSKMLTGEKTWYEERLGVEALTVTDKVSAWNHRLKITQSKTTFQQSARDLRSLSVSSLLLFFPVSKKDKKNSEKNAWLLSVANKYFPERPHHELVAQDIFKMIFKRENMATSQGYDDLVRLEKLLDWQRVVDIQIQDDDIKIPWTKTNNTLRNCAITSGQDMVDRVSSIINTRFFRGYFCKPELPKVSEKRELAPERQDKAGKRAKNSR